MHCQQQQMLADLSYFKVISDFFFLPYLRFTSNPFSCLFPNSHKHLFSRPNLRFLSNPTRCRLCVVASVFVFGSRCLFVVVVVFLSLSFPYSAGFTSDEHFQASWYPPYRETGSRDTYANPNTMFWRLIVRVLLTFPLKENRNGDAS